MNLDQDVVPTWLGPIGKHKASRTGVESFELIGFHGSLRRLG